MVRASSWVISAPLGGKEGIDILKLHSSSRRGRVQDVRQDIHAAVLPYDIRGSFVPPGTCWLEDT